MRFEDFWAHRSYVARVLHSMGVTTDEMDDALQEVYILVFRNLDKFQALDDPRANLGSMLRWLSVIARNYHISSKRKHRFVEAPLAPDYDAAQDVEAPSHPDFDITEYLPLLTPEQRAVLEDVLAGEKIGRNEGPKKLKRRAINSIRRHMGLPYVSL